MASETANTLGEPPKVSDGVKKSFRISAGLLFLLLFFCVAFKEDNQLKAFDQGSWHCDLLLSQISGKVHYAFTATEQCEFNKLLSKPDGYVMSDEYMQALNAHFLKPVDNSKLAPIERLAVCLQKRPKILDAVKAKLYDKTGCYIDTLNLGSCESTEYNEFDWLGLILPVKYQAEGELAQSSAPRFVNSWRVDGLPETYAKPPINIP